MKKRERRQTDREEEVPKHGYTSVYRKTAQTQRWKQNLAVR